MDEAPRFWSVEGFPLAVECCYPEAETAESFDLCLSAQICPVHGRTVYYCTDAGVFWCDGLDAAGGWHVHTFALVPRGGEDGES